MIGTRTLQALRDVLPRRLEGRLDSPNGGELTEDEALRKRCLEWAFQTREFRYVPHMQVVNVAQEYYDFIRRTPAWRRREAYSACGADEALDRERGEGKG